MADGYQPKELVVCLQEMQRLLFVFSKLNPGLQYVQGMNELVAPLYMVFKIDAASATDAQHAEADTFFCFVKLLTFSENRDLYCKSLDKSNTGVKATMQQCALESKRMFLLAHSSVLYAMPVSLCDGLDKKCFAGL
jgi:hypothetical protein